MSRETAGAPIISTDIETVEDDPTISVCLLSQCKGCNLCQIAEVTEATDRIQALAEAIEEYELLVDAAKLELQHLLELRRLLCQHFWEIQLGRQLCRRCGKTQAREKV
jgi:hypothetical protein